MEEATPLTGVTRDPNSLAVRAFRSSFEAMTISNFEDINLNLADQRRISLSYDNDTGAITGETTDGQRLFQMETDGWELAYEIDDPEATEEVSVTLDRAIEAYQQEQEEITAQQQASPELGLG